MSRRLSIGNATGSAAGANGLGLTPSEIQSQMLALLTLDLQNQPVTILDIVVTPQGGFELNIIGLCPPILSVLHSVFIPTIIPRMIGLSPGTHLQMTSPFECILQSIAAPPSPPFLPPSPGSRNISVVVGDMGAVSGAAAVGTLVLLLLLLIFQRWRRHRKAMLKEPHLEQGLRAHHTELMALNGNPASETRARDAATTTARAQAFVHACAATPTSQPGDSQKRRRGRHD